MNGTAAGSRTRVTVGTRFRKRRPVSLTGGTGAPVAFEPRPTLFRQQQQQHPPTTTRSFSLTHTHSLSPESLSTAATGFARRRRVHSSTSRTSIRVPVRVRTADRHVRRPTGCFPVRFSSPRFSSSSSPCDGCRSCHVSVPTDSPDDSFPADRVYGARVR